MDAEAALNRIRNQLADIDDALEHIDNNGDAAEIADRLESIRQGLTGIGQTIENKGSLSSAQRGAIFSYCDSADRLIEQLDD